MLSAELISELKRIELRTRRKMSSSVVGNYRSAFRGQGLVFSDLREYQPGDDTKNIDWKSSAKTGRVFVKSYEEDRSLNLISLVDVSRSTAFGAPKNKHAKALEFAAIVSILASRSRDAMGLGLFSDKVEEFIAPKQNRGQLYRILSKLMSFAEPSGKTDLNPILRYLHDHQKRRSVIFIISDFFAPDFEQSLKPLARKHDLIAVLLEDKLDFELPKAGLVEFQGAEDGRSVLIDTSHPKAAKLVREIHEKRAFKLREFLRGLQVDLIRISDNPLPPLAELMRQRAARLR